MNTALKYGLIAAAAGLGIYSIVKSNKDEEEEQKNSDKILALQQFVESSQPIIITRKINNKVLKGSNKLNDTVLDAFEAKAGKTYLVCVSFFGSCSGVGVVGAACENWQVRFPQSVDKYDYGVQLTAIIKSEETKAVAIRALHHSSITITTGDIVIIEL